jgi:hypothetical protein
LIIEGEEIKSLNECKVINEETLNNESVKDFKNVFFADFETFTQN